MRPNAARQMTASTGVYPTLQGRRLSLSPFAIVLALLELGSAGALIAVPVTLALVIACEHFRSTEWIALLSSQR
jgi:AI-2 transport protein TqsA